MSSTQDVQGVRQTSVGGNLKILDKQRLGGSGKNETEVRTICKNFFLSKNLKPVHSLRLVHESDGKNWLNNTNIIIFQLFY